MPPQVTSQANTLKTESLELDGITFSTTQFGAMRAFKLMARLIKQVGPAMGALTGAEATTELSTMGPALVGALESLDPDEAARLLLDILAGTSALVDGKNMDFIGKTAQSNFDIVFTGRLGTMFKVVGAALQLNYSDFFAGVTPETPVTTMVQR